MSSVLLVVLMLFISSLVVSVMRWRAKKSDEDPVNAVKDKEAEEKYTALCVADETISVVCRGYKEEYYILTNKRMIIDNKKGLHSIPLDTIKKVDFRKADGGKARQPLECQIMTIHTDRKYTLARYSEKFDQITNYFFYRV